MSEARLESGDRPGFTCAVKFTPTKVDKAMVLRKINAVGAAFLMDSISSRKDRRKVELPFGQLMLEIRPIGH